MMFNARSQSRENIAMQKRRLQAESAVYRASLVSTVQDIRRTLNAGESPKGVTGFLWSVAVGLLKARAGANSSAFGILALPTLVPLIVKAYAALSKPRSSQGGKQWQAVIAVAAITIFIWLKRKSDEKNEAGCQRR